MIAQPPGPALSTPRGPLQKPSPQLLFRHVAQGHIADGEPTKDAFVLRSRDNGLLSVSLQSKTTAQGAYALRAKHAKGGPPAGIWAVSVQEAHSIGLDAYSDPAGPPKEEWEDPAHGGIDFRAICTDKKAKMAREKELLDFALQRGAVYRP
jgi:hypothetical protein